MIAKKPSNRLARCWASRVNAFDGEKSVVTKVACHSRAGQATPHIVEFQTVVSELLAGNGKVARVSKVAGELSDKADREEQARVAFLSQLCPDLIVISEDDHFYSSVGLKSAGDEKSLKAQVASLIESIKQIGEPKSIADIAQAANLDDATEAAALASTSKHLATLNDRWGLIKWPMVNPKNIRDKIYVILKKKTVSRCILTKSPKLSKIATSSAKTLLLRQSTTNLSKTSASS